jgi:hypothetical protein
MTSWRGRGSSRSEAGQPACFTSSTLVSATVGSGTNRQPLSPDLTQTVAQQTVTWAGQITQMPGASAAGAVAGRPAGWALRLGRLQGPAPGRPGERRGARPADQRLAGALPGPDRAGLAGGGLGGGQLGHLLGAILVDLALTVALVWPDPGLSMAKQISRTVSGSVAMSAAAVAIGLALNETPPALNGAGVAQDVVKPLPWLLSWMLIAPIRTAIWAATEETVDPAALKLVADLASSIALPILHDKA